MKEVPGFCWICLIPIMVSRTSCERSVWRNVSGDKFFYAFWTIFLWNRLHQRAFIGCIALLCSCCFLLFSFGLPSLSFLHEPHILLQLLSNVSHVTYIYWYKEQEGRSKSKTFIEVLFELSKMIHHVQCSPN